MSRMERETGIEPATNSLEGCDSTTELLPPSRLATPLARRFGGVNPPIISSSCAFIDFINSTRLGLPGPKAGLPSRSPPTLASFTRASYGVAKAGGQGRIRTFVATGATDLQSVAIDRSATCPLVVRRHDLYSCHPPAPGDTAVAARGNGSKKSSLLRMPC